MSSTLSVSNIDVIIDDKNILTIGRKNEYRIFDKLSAANRERGTLLALQNMNLINGKTSQTDDEQGGAAIYGRTYGKLIAMSVPL